MGVLDKIFGQQPFEQLHEHAKKVYECVELMRPLTDALLNGEYNKIEELHNQMSRTEHEADQIKNHLRDVINDMYFLSVGKQELSKFLSYQDDVADAAEDFSVVLLLRNTKFPPELKEDFVALVEQIIKMCETLLKLSEKLSDLVEGAFTGKMAREMLETIEKIGEEEWAADKLSRKFSRHAYKIEDQIDPITLMFMDKYCKTLSAVANNAEKTAKYLRLIVRRR